MTGVTFRGLLATVLAAALAWSAHAANPVEDKPNSPPNVIDGAELVQALRGGGYVLYFRHGLTDLSTRDVDRGSLSNCATQRILSDAGRQQMTDIGRQFKRCKFRLAPCWPAPTAARSTRPSSPSAR